MSKQDVNRTAASPVPAYVIGIDEPQGFGYIHSQPSSKTGGRMDILAEVLRDNSSVGRFFRVEVVGRLDLPGLPEIRRSIRVGRKKHQSEYTAPFCVLLFDVRTNKGFYRWLAEPVVSDDEAALNEEPDGPWQPLDEKAASNLVDLVNVWYDALALQLKT